MAAKSGAVKAPARKRSVRVLPKVDVVSGDVVSAVRAAAAWTIGDRGRAAVLAASAIRLAEELGHSEEILQSPNYAALSKELDRVMLELGRLHDALDSKDEVAETLSAPVWDSPKS
jgi:hypothetical protein